MGGGGGGGGWGLIAGRLISSSLWYITGGGDLGIFYWWGSKLWFKRDCWTFLWQITSHRDDHGFLNL